MADVPIQVSVLDARDRVANYRWAQVADPPAGSGVMTHEDGRPMTEAEVDDWFADRLRARGRA